ncbi:MAG TPA: hypothetical protein VEF55_11100 [Candidatus Binatia bacterium]|nr:hypothetical protein [Candidatus Binatia bacterium]
MAAKAKKQKRGRLAEAAVDYFAARSHDAWRRNLLKAQPEQKGTPRMRLRGGVMVDVNQPWTKLHPKAKADNKQAAYDAYDAVKKFPNDQEAAAEYVHQRWIKRNKGDPNQPKALFKPYAGLPEVEKDKDRAHVDNMKKALAAVRKDAPKGKAKRAAATITVDAKAWRRLTSAARQLSTALGRPVQPEALLAAGMEAMAAVCEAIASEARATKT